MTATTTKGPYVLRAADIAARAERHSHPWNPSSERVGRTMLGRAHLLSGENRGTDVVDFSTLGRETVIVDSIADGAPLELGPSADGELSEGT